MDAIYVSKVRHYATPGVENDDTVKPQAAFSVGIAVASRLNGDEELVGTYDPEDDRPIKVGFVTSRSKFDSEEAAIDHVGELRKKYRVGSTLNAKKWSWGEEMPDNTSDLHASNPRGGTNATVHKVKYMMQDVSAPAADVRAMASAQTTQPAKSEPSK